MLFVTTFFFAVGDEAEVNRLQQPQPGRKLASDTNNTTSETLKLGKLAGRTPVVGAKKLDFCLLWSQTRGRRSKDTAAAADSLYIMSTLLFLHSLNDGFTSSLACFFRCIQLRLALWADLQHATPPRLSEGGKKINGVFDERRQDCEAGREEEFSDMPWMLLSPN